MRRRVAVGLVLALGGTGCLGIDLDEAGEPAMSDPAGGSDADPATPGEAAPPPSGTGEPAPASPGGSDSPGGSAPAGCSRYVDGASGNELDGRIPVCCTPDAEGRALVDEALRLLNQHRAANGRPALMWDDALAAAIQGHVDHMAAHTFFDHEAPEAVVASPWDRARMCGARANAENIARGQRAAADVMRSWSSSSGHNRNMLNAEYRRVGIGYRDRTWGQIFGE